MRHVHTFRYEKSKSKISGVRRILRHFEGIEEICVMENLFNLI